MATPASTRRTRGMPGEYVVLPAGPSERGVCVAMHSVVVTGCSTGIGSGTASVLIRAWLPRVRQRADRRDAERLARELGPRSCRSCSTSPIEDRRARRRRTRRRGAGGETLVRPGQQRRRRVSRAAALSRQSETSGGRSKSTSPASSSSRRRSRRSLAPTRPATGAPGRIVMMSSVGGRNGSPFLGPTTPRSSGWRACRRACGVSS